MAETLVSPGVLTRENDQSFITQQPVQVGAAIVGPTVKGPVEVPTIVTSYSDFQNKFGSTFESGSEIYSYFTSIAAYNYFNNNGNTLLVTRVVSGSATAWDYASAAIPAGGDTPLSETGTILVDTDMLGAVVSGGVNGVPGTYSSVTTTSGAGTGLQLEVTTTSTGELVLGKEMVSSLAVNPTDLDPGIYTNVVSNQGGEFTIEAQGPAGGATITSIIVTSTTGTSPFSIGDALDIPGSSFGTGSDANLLLQAGDVATTVTAVTAVAQGTGYDIGDGVEVALANIGNADANLVLTVRSIDLENEVAFELEAIDQGAIWNNQGTILSQGALENGTIDNVRWQIATRNTASGTFSLIIRRGDDNNNNPVVLESWNNLSLDPTQGNFISRVIGDTSFTYNSAENYLQVNGAYPNASRYVRVKSVNLLTPNYLDNAGNAKPQYTGSIPAVGSGSYGGAFDGGVGSILGATAGNYYQNAAYYGSNDTQANNTQGLVGSDYTNMLNLLSNQDDYSFNALFTPGLFNSVHASQVTTAINNTQMRGDSIYVIDPVAYGSTISAATTQAGSRNSSYAAMYWPWVQTIDPDSGKNVWVPVSTMIAGVYAYNDSVSEPWFAPAGINRGGLTNVIRAERKLTQSNRDTLYEDNVNPIASFPGTGTVVYGQKTLQRQASALDRVNVRRLLIALKSYIGQVSQNLVFEQNTAATRNNFLAAVNPYLESVQQRQGLYAFKVVMDDSNNTPDVIDRNQLVGQIYLQPTKTAEFIILDFNVLPTGATFPA